MLNNGVRELTATAGTGTVTLDAVTGFARFADAFTNGSLASYAIRDGNNWEWGVGTVGAANTLARTTITGSLVAGVFTTGGTAITLASGAALVFVADHTGTTRPASAILNLSGTNTGDQTITLTGGVTGSGTGSFAATVVTNANLTGPVTSTGNATAIAAGAISNAMLANGAVANLSGTNTGDNAVNTLYSGLVSNATHTGDATGSTALTVVALNNTNLAALATGILKNTTTTGVPSIAVNSDLPTMSSTVGGAVPTPPNNTTTFLRGDGTFATPAGSGDMVLASVQTNSALKTFLDATFGLRNVANTITSLFTNAATIARTWTLPNKDGTVAMTSDITGTNSGTNTGDQTITLTGGVTGSGTGSFAATVVTNANLTGGVTSVGNAATVITNANLTGVVTSTGNATAIADNALSIAKTSGLQTALDGKQPIDAALTALAAGSDFVQFTGPASSTKVFTLPDASSTILVSGGALGTPSSGVATNLTGTASGLTAGTVTTNANLTGDATSSGNATTVVKINGTTLSALATGILKNTTGTGVPSIAVNSDLPAMSATVGGAVPTPPNNTTTFLRGDGTFAAPAGSGTVTSVGFTGGLISVATATTTPALTVAGTSGGIPYFSGATTWATSAALAANALVVGGGAGVAPSTVTTGTNVLTALGIAIGSAGAPVTFNGALGTPSSGTVTNLTGTASININGTVGATTPTTVVGTTGVFGSTTSLLLGTAGSAVGNIGFRNATSGTATIAPPTGALGAYSVTLPNAASTLPIFPQQVTFTGPSVARTITVPDANFTVARTDAANTFTGVQTMTSPALTTPAIGAATGSSVTLTGTAPQVVIGANTTTLGSVKMFGNTSGDATVRPAAVAGTATVVTLPNANSTLPIFGQQITFTGPSTARTITLPDANFTVARTDAANTFTGVQTMTSPNFTTPVLGTPTSGVVTNLTGTASININGTVGATTPTTGSFTTGVFSSTIKGATTIGVGGATPAASGAGITFPATQSASSDANTLDDYEEGTFTPTISGRTVAGLGTYTTQIGRYTKIGRIVHVMGSVVQTAHTGTGNMALTALPFTSANNADIYPVSLLDYGTLTVPANSIPVLLMDINTTSAKFIAYTTASAGTSALALDVACTIYFSLTYEVA